MDDTSRRVAPNPHELRGRSSETTGQSDEQLRGYAGADPQPARTAAPGAVPGSAPDSADESGVDERTSQIRDEIAQTREEMTETIDAIQEKLRPSNIMADATERVKHAATEGVHSMTDMVSDTASDMMDYGREAYDSVAGEVRQNPIPLAMIGIGTAWLLFGHNRSASDHERGRPEGLWRRAHDERYGRFADYRAGDYRAAEYREIGHRQGGGIANTVSDHPIPSALAAMGLAWLAFSGRGGHSSSSRGWNGERWVSNDEWRRQYRDAKRQTPGGTGTRAGTGDGDDTTSGGMYESVKDSAGEMASTAQQYAGRAQEYAGEALETVQRRGRRAQSQLERMMHENPLLVGAGALAVGAVIGMALPETERENEWMGEARDSMVEQAQTMARQAAAKVQDAAGDVVGEVAGRVVSGQ